MVMLLRCRAKKVQQKVGPENAAQDKAWAQTNKVKKDLFSQPNNLAISTPHLTEFIPINIYHAKKKGKTSLFFSYIQKIGKHYQKKLPDPK